MQSRRLNEHETLELVKRTKGHPLTDLKSWIMANKAGTFKKHQNLVHRI